MMSNYKEEISERDFEELVEAVRQKEEERHQLIFAKVNKTMERARNTLKEANTELAKLEAIVAEKKQANTTRNQPSPPNLNGHYAFLNQKNTTNGGSETITDFSLNENNAYSKK